MCIIHYWEPDSEGAFLISLWRSRSPLSPARWAPDYIHTDKHGCMRGGSIRATAFRLKRQEMRRFSWRGAVVLPHWWWYSSYPFSLWQPGSSEANLQIKRSNLRPREFWRLPLLVKTVLVLIWFLKHISYQPSLFVFLTCVSGTQHWHE